MRLYALDWHSQLFSALPRSVALFKSPHDLFAIYELDAHSIKRPLSCENWHHALQPVAQPPPSQRPRRVAGVTGLVTHLRDPGTAMLFA